ncbi:MAG: hypothetical protein AAFV85_05590 [Cyanobacteria bacterium J06634_6]
MANPFPPETVQSLADRIDAQISVLSAGGRESYGVSTSSSAQRSLDPESTSPLAVQAAEIERITQEKPVRFLKKFRRAAKQDICEEDGVLNAQWKKWKDLASEDVVKSFGPYLVAMGFSGVLLESLVVAVGVTVIHIGLVAFCEDLEEEATETTAGESIVVNFPRSYQALLLLHYPVKRFAACSASFEYVTEQHL